MYTDPKKDFVMRMAKTSAEISCKHCSIFDEKGKMFAPMMPDSIAEELGLSKMAMMYAWKRLIYRNGWNIVVKDGSFVCPDHAKRMNPSDLELSGDIDDFPGWVKKEADRYDQWVEELKNY